MTVTTDERGVQNLYNKEPQMTRFLAMQLAKSHYFNHRAAQEDFNYKAICSVG